MLEDVLQGPNRDIGRPECCFACMVPCSRMGCEGTHLLFLRFFLVMAEGYRQQQAFHAPPPSPLHHCLEVPCPEPFPEPVSDQPMKPGTDTFSPDDVTALPPLPISDWTCEMVVVYLRKILEAKYPSAPIVERCVEALRRNYIDGESIVTLTPSDWHAIIPEAGPRCCIRRVVDSWPRSTCKPNKKEPLPLPHLDEAECTSPRPSERAASLFDALRRTQSRSSSMQLEAAMRDAELRPHKMHHWLPRSFGRSPFNYVPLVGDMRPASYHAPWARWLFNRGKLYLLQLAFHWYTFLFDVIQPMDALGAVFTAFCLWGSYKLELFFDHSPSIVVAAIIFPIAFCMNAAYSRREHSLQMMAMFKGACLAVVAEHGAWAAYVTNNPEVEREFSCEHFFRYTVQRVDNIQRNLRLYLSDIPHRDKILVLQDLYIEYHRLVIHTQLLVDAGAPAPLIASLKSQLPRLYEAVERLRSSRDYRTPSSIKACMHIAIILVILYLSPYWANQMRLHPEQHVVVYCFALCFYWLMISLISLERKLESPFDMDQDDIATATYNLYAVFSSEQQEHILSAALKTPPATK